MSSGEAGHLVDLDALAQEQPKTSSTTSSTTPAASNTTTADLNGTLENAKNTVVNSEVSQANRAIREVIMALTLHSNNLIEMAQPLLDQRLTYYSCIIRHGHHCKPPCYPKRKGHSRQR